MLVRETPSGASLPEGVHWQKAFSTPRTIALTSPILRRVVVTECLRTDGHLTVILGQIFHAIGGSAFQHGFVDRHDIAALVHVVVQNGPWNRTVLLAHA